jgi:mRNA-degrading endonuclease toxin of MazEF toxin-antitoxin module
MSRLGHAGSKPRPALVLSADAFHRKLPDPIVFPISSQPRFCARPGGRDHPLRHWKDLGLRYPSTARLSNLMAVEKRLIKRELASSRICSKVPIFSASSRNRRTACLRFLRAFSLLLLHEVAGARSSSVGRGRRVWGDGATP